MKNYNWRSMYSTMAQMDDLTDKFYDITGNILNDYIIEGFKQIIKDIKDDYTTEQGRARVYTEEQLDKVRQVNKICRQIAKFEF